jgi:ABC-type cobalt transport system, permease component CbiQ and related transporters
VEALRAFKTIKKDSPYDRLDPRTRFFLSTVLALLAIYSSRLDTQLIVLTCVLSLSFMAKRVRVILRGLYGSLFLLALIFTLNFVFTPNLQGAIYALVMTLRFTTLITSFALFFNSTSPEEIGIALEGVGVPRDFSLLINMSFRFVPTLANDIQIVSDALRSRGLELEKRQALQQDKKLCLPTCSLNNIRGKEKHDDCRGPRGKGVRARREAHEACFSKVLVERLLGYRASTTGDISIILFWIPLKNTIWEWRALGNSWAGQYIDPRITLDKTW